MIEGPTSGNIYAGMSPVDEPATFLKIRVEKGLEFWRSLSPEDQKRIDYEQGENGVDRSIYGVFYLQHRSTAPTHWYEAFRKLEAEEKEASIHKMSRQELAEFLEQNPGHEKGMSAALVLLLKAE